MRADIFPSDSMCFANVVRPDFRGSSCQTHTRVQQRAKRAEMEAGRPYLQQAHAIAHCFIPFFFLHTAQLEAPAPQNHFLETRFGNNNQINRAGLICEHALTLSLRPCAEPPAAAPESSPPHPAAAAQLRLCQRRRQRPRAVPRAGFQMRWLTPRAA